jgi:FMN-dependent NADH-azoreductase
MPKLLHVQSSPNVMESVTRRLSQQFVDTWVESHDGFEVDTVDLALDPLPHLGPNELGGLFAPPEMHTPEMAEAAALSDRLITQVEEAEVIVIGAPMINFTIPTQLKAWFDFISVAGRTFSFAAPGQAKGMLFGKKVFVINARGGDYSFAPVSAFDFQEPLLRMLLMFIGLMDVSFIRAEGVRAYEDDAEAITTEAEAVIARLAA